MVTQTLSSEVNGNFECDVLIRIETARPTAKIEK